MGDLDPLPVHAFLGPSESITQTASRSFSRFCIAHGGVSLEMSGHALRPQNCPFPWVIWNPISHMVPWAHPTYHPKWHLERVSHLCTAHDRQSLYFTMGLPSPEIAHSYGDLDSHLIHCSMGLPESTTQTSSRLVQPFLRSSRHSIPILYSGPLIPPPQNFPFPWGDLDPHLIRGFLIALELSAQTASRSVQQFLQGWLLWQTNQQTTLLGR